MTEQILLGNASEVPPGKMKGFIVNGTKVLVANLDGKFYAINSVCTHMGGPLDRGKLDGGVVTCPWHGSKFDVTSGSVVSGPAPTPEPTHKVSLDGENLLLEV